MSRGCNSDAPGRVVQADDGDVIGDDELGLRDGLQGADGHEVVGHEHRVRVWFLVQQLVHGQPGVELGMIVEHPGDRRGGNPGGADRVDCGHGWSLLLIALRCPIGTLASHPVLFEGLTSTAMLIDDYHKVTDGGPSWRSTSERPGLWSLDKACSCFEGLTGEWENRFLEVPMARAGRFPVDKAC